MRVSAAALGLAAFGNTVYAGIYYGASSSAVAAHATGYDYAPQSTAHYAPPTYIPVEQIGDGQIQKPNSTPSYGTPAPAPSCYTPPPPPPAPPAPPASFSNRTVVITTPRIITSHTTRPPTAVVPSVTGSRPPPAVVETNAANAVVGGTVGLGFAAFIVALLG